ncbi:MAG: glycosyltransferase, partial [Bacteroidaceae bacterium]|nr:glycosyltransferase [Bacteroidaceae bacterium]
MRISLITSTYNSVSTLKSTFDSVLSQTYSDVEYLVVDGGSKDGTLELIKEYEPKFGGRMKWLSEPDKGLYDALNKGIRMATGDVVGILNSDDFFTTNDVLETVATELNGVDAIYG